MIRWRLAAPLLAAVLAGCSGLTPFVTGPPPLASGEKDPGKRVSVCYNTFKTPPEKLKELAQTQCSGGTAAEPIDTDYRLDNCPAMTPGRATFVCKAVK